MFKIPTAVHHLRTHSNCLILVLLFASSSQAQAIFTESGPAHIDLPPIGTSVSSLSFEYIARSPIPGGVNLATSGIEFNYPRALNAGPGELTFTIKGQSTGTEYEGHLYRGYWAPYCLGCEPIPNPLDYRVIPGTDFQGTVGGDAAHIGLSEATSWTGISLDNLSAQSGDFVLTFSEPYPTVVGVPEPSTGLLMGLGFASLGLIAHRR